MGPSKNYTTEQLKEKRVAIDSMIQFFADEQEKGIEGVAISDFSLYNTAGYQAHVKLIEAKMWIGKMIEAQGKPLPAEFADKAQS